MLKVIVLLGFFFLTSAVIWALGLHPYKETYFNYLVFASQLLYGNLCYDALKSLREIPQGNEFWPSAVKVVGEAATLMIVAIGLLLVAIKVFVFAYAGLIGAVVAYAAIFMHTMPKLKPIYAKANPSISTPRPSA